MAHDPVGLTHFLHADQIAVVAVAVGADGNVEIHQVVDFVRLLLAQVPGHAGAAQHRAGEAQRQCALGCHNADPDRALLPDPVLGEQRFVLVDVGREALGEIFYEVEHRPPPVPVESRDRLR